MTDPADKKSFRDKIENGVGTVISRMIVITMVPATLGLGGWIGTRIIGQMDKLIEKVAVQHEDTQKQINSLDVRLTGAERDIKYLSDRR